MTTSAGAKGRLDGWTALKCVGSTESCLAVTPRIEMKFS